MSRYFYELMKFLTTVPDAQTDLMLGISGTVYPFAELASSQGAGNRFSQMAAAGNAALRRQ